MSIDEKDDVEYGLKDSKGYLLDASALITLIKHGKIGTFDRSAILDLTIYESMNAIWKEYSLLKNLDDVTAFKLLNILNKIFNIVERISIVGYEEDVLALAYKEKITVYDASYICIARVRDLVLVTNDMRLRAVASRYVGTVQP
ncbi:MAG: type II toxin-antitoxin system VapC family toxin [Candidatus Nitrosocaldus sp.]